jgi:N-acetylneuraminic acid mutarotase
MTKKNLLLVAFSLSVCAVVYGREPPLASWIPANPMHRARAFFAAVELPNGNVLVAGGFDNNIDLGDSEIYHWRTGIWTPTTPMKQLRAAPVAVQLENGRVLVIGGGTWTRANQNNVFLSSCEIYDPRTNTWSFTGSMNDARFEDFAAFLLPGHKVLVAGGAGNAPGNPVVPGLNSAEIYDETAGTWRRTSSMSTPRGELAAAILRDGRVLVTGGWPHDGAASTNTAEIFDPVTEKWSSAGSMGAARADHVAVVLRDGRVLVAGGLFPTEEFPRLESAEIFDPDTGKWTPTGNMTYPNSDAAALVLPDGRVLVTGGHINHETESSSATLYDPETGTWSPAGFMSTVRAGHAAIMLPGDRGVLVIGGLYNSPLATPNADIFELCRCPEFR